MNDKESGASFRCYYCLKFLVWDEKEQKCWCPDCKYVMPKG